MIPLLLFQAQLTVSASRYFASYTPLIDCEVHSIIVSFISISLPTLQCLSSPAMLWILLTPICGIAHLELYAKDYCHPAPRGRIPGYKRDDLVLLHPPPQGFQYRTSTMPHQRVLQVTGYSSPCGAFNNTSFCTSYSGGSRGVSEVSGNWSRFQP